MDLLHDVVYSVEAIPVSRRTIRGAEEEHRDRCVPNDAVADDHPENRAQNAGIVEDEM